MSEPATRTVYLGIQETNEHYVVGPTRTQISVPWCDEHDVQTIDPLLYCWHGYYLEGDCAVGTATCRLRDPHAPNAVWRDTET